MTTTQGTPNIITYHSVPESHGGTFTFSGNVYNNHNIGTSDLRTCVGVYIPIDSQRCFFAHILACRARHLLESNDNPFMDLTDEQQLHVRNEVRDRLQRHSQNNGWSARDVNDFLRQQPERKIVVMCPCYSDQPGRPGVAVLQGLEDFVGGRPSWRIENGDENQQGFAVNHIDGSVSVMRRLWGGGRTFAVMLIREDPGFVPVIEPTAMKEWHVEA